MQMVSELMYNYGKKLKGGIFVKRTILTLSIGIFIGLLAGSVNGTFAAVAETVQAKFAKFSLVINKGEPIEIEPLAYNGKTYLPVREIANLLGYDVMYKADSRTIELNRSAMEVNELVDKTTFKGMRAIVVSGETYFSWKDYLDKFLLFSFGLAYDKDDRTFTYVETESPESSAIKNKYMEISQDEPGAFYAYNGESYINVKYYREPSDFVQNN